MNCKPEIVQKYLKQYDCLYAYYHFNYTVREQYKIAHGIEDLDFVLGTIKDFFPDIYSSAQKYINGYKHYFCNMFVLNRKLFKQYCRFAFDILSKFDKWRDLAYSSIEERRFFISERITGIFIQYLIDNGKKCCPLNISFLENTSIKQNIKPVFQKNNIPVVFSVDDKYVPYLGVTLFSLIKNSKSTNNYDLFILYHKLSETNKEKLKSLLDQYSNISLRFIDITPYLTTSDVSQFHLGIEHISIATYYRFLIADIFSNYKKIIYLDSDLIINKDIAELYHYNIQNSWLGAVVDIRESIPVKLNSCPFGNSWRDYVSNTLGVQNPYEYFQAGVLIFNIQQFIKNNVREKLFAKIKQIPKPCLMDQDILNSVCYKHITFLPVSWNIEWQISFEYPDYRAILLKDFYLKYQDALKSKNIIHYASPVKLWNNPDKYLADYWWEYARETPFYEEILRIMLEKRNETHIVPDSDEEFYNHFLEKIFSLKNSKNKQHKVITILGIKFKIKNIKKDKK